MKLPPEAFEFYVGLGVERSYQLVAEHYGVTKVAVAKRAKRDDWQERLRRLEDRAREESDKRSQEGLEAVRARQLKAVRFLQAKAIEVIRDQPPEKAVRAASALNIAWKHELLLLGEPTERQANVEEVIRREYERWMVLEEEDDDDEGPAPEQARALP